jgi:hypothetical protein
LAIWRIADILKGRRAVSFNVLVSDGFVAISALEHKGSVFCLFAAHSQMVGRSLTLLALLGFAVRPGADETLFGVENGMLRLDRFSTFVFFGGIVGVAPGKVVLGLTLVAFDKIKVVAFFEYFVLHVFKAIA